MFTKVAALELERYSIRANGVPPGTIIVERTLQDDPDYATTWAEATPLGRASTSADVGRIVAFLASDQAFIRQRTDDMGRWRRIHRTELALQN